MTDIVLEPMPGFREPETLAKTADAGVKSILLHIQNDSALVARIENALSIARGCGAHLSCVHVTPIEAYVAFDSFGGVFVMNSVMKALDEEEAALKLRVEEQLRKEDVSWDFVQVTGNVVGQVVSRSALSDLVVTGRMTQPADFAGSGLGFLGDLLHRSRTPLLIAGDNGEPCDPSGPALIAWDGSYEAANTVRSAIGLLKLASEVRVLQVKEQEKDEIFPRTGLLEYLSRHGIHAELQVEPAPAADKADFVAALIVAQARAIGAAYILMGGYNHSRTGEYLFGGVTRTMLTACPLPLVIAR